MSVTGPGSGSTDRPLHASPEPRALLVLLGEAVALQRQVALPELLLDELETADSLLLVAARDALGGEADVGQLRQLRPPLHDLIRQRLRLRRLLQHAEQDAHVRDLGEPVVGDQLARQLEDPLRDLRELGLLAGIEDGGWERGGMGRKECFQFK